MTMLFPLFLVALLPVTLALADSVALGFGVINNSSLSGPLPCTIYLFVKKDDTLPWTLCDRYKCKQGTSPMADLIPGSQYQLIVACPNTVQVDPGRKYFSAPSKKTLVRVVDTFILTDTPKDLLPSDIVNTTCPRISFQQPKKSKKPSLEPKSNTLLEPNNTTDLPSAPNKVEVPALEFNEPISPPSIPPLLLLFLALCLLALGVMYPLALIVVEKRTKARNDEILAELQNGPSSLEVYSIAQQQ